MSVAMMRRIGAGAMPLASEPARDAPVELIPDAAEASLLGALLDRPRLLAAVPAELRPLHFADEDRADLFAALQELGPKDGPASIDVIRLLGGTQETRERVAALVGTAVSYLPDQIASYAGHVIDAHHKRACLAISSHLCDALITSGPTPAREAVAQAVAALEATLEADVPGRDMVWLAEAVAETLAAAERARRGDTPAGLATGFPSLDARMAGLDPGTLHVLAGRPGSGKTALGWQVALNAARAGKGVIVLSLEMSAEQLSRRALAAISGVPGRDIKAGAYDLRQGEALARAQCELNALPLLLCDRAGQTAGQIALRVRTARRRLAKRGGLGLILVDHLHIVAPDQVDGRANNAQVFRRISGAMKRLSKDAGCPVLLLAQLNRQVENRENKRPHLSDLRESGSIEEDADSVSFVYRAEYYAEKAPPERKIGESEATHRSAVAEWEEQRRALDGQAEVLIEKLRDGEPGVVELRFDKHLTRFVDPVAGELR